MRKAPYIILALVLVAIISTAWATIFWTQSLPSTFYLIAETYGCALFTDANCTIPTTTVKFSNITVTKQTTYTPSEPIWVKWTGTGNYTGTKYFTIYGTLPTGFTGQFSLNGMRPLGEVSTIPSSLFETRIDIKGDGARPVGTFNATFTFSLQDST